MTQTATAPKKITETKWNRLVERGRALADADRGEPRFEIGDLALEAEAIGSPGVSTGALDRLRQYAEDIGMSFSTLREYRRVAEAWTNDTRVSLVAWTVHRDLAREPDRAALIVSQDWTPASIAALKAERYPKVLFRMFRPSAPTDGAEDPRAHT